MLMRQSINNQLFVSQSVTKMHSIISLLLQCCEFIIVSINSLLLISSCVCLFPAIMFLCKISIKMSFVTGLFSCWKQHQKMLHCSHKWMGGVNSSCRLWRLHDAQSSPRESPPHYHTTRSLNADTR